VTSNIYAIFTRATPTAREYGVNMRRLRVKVPSGLRAGVLGEGMLASGWPPSGRPRVEGHAPMADLAFTVLLIAGFAVLALTLRGLEKL